ncbi:hypothetical protein SLA2020_429830 [Shorea laevis]
MLLIELCWRNAMDHRNGKAGTTMISRDSTGKMLDGIAFVQSVATVLLAETLAALRSAVRWAVRNGVERLIFESDCKELIQVLNRKVDAPWLIEPLVRSIWMLIASLSFYAFFYI